MKVAIVALGPSCLTFARMAEAAGHPRRQFDQIYLCNGNVNVYWPPNNTGVGFAMDDLKVQERRAKEAGNTKIGLMLESYKDHPGPIFTSREYPDYPSCKAFPLEDVVNYCGSRYFNNTVAYMVAYAIYKRASEIYIFGADYTYPDRHMAEEGRACTEHWLGIAKGRGIKLFPVKTSQILDANKDDHPYGYDSQDIEYKEDEHGYVHVNLTDRADHKVPTGREMEKRYYKGDGSKKEAA